MLEWLDRDGRLVIVEKALRTIPYGFLGVLYPVYLSQSGLSTIPILIVLGLTTSSSAAYTFMASLFADRLGRRRTLVFFAVMDAFAGAVLLVFRSWWGPVLAGIVGNMTVGSGEVGPFLSLEQAILPRSSSYEHRALAFSVYNLTGYLSSAAGAVLVGLPLLLGFAPSDYRLLFIIYLASGVVGAFVYSRLSKRTELTSSPTETSRPPTRRMSPRSRSVILRLSGLFAVDAFGGGFIGLSIISYYFYQRYALDLSSLGLVVAAASMVTAFSFLLSARISRRIGLLKTMVFTHIPSNLILITVPLAPTLSSSVFLLLCRQSLSQMDVPARQAYVVSVVPEEDRMPASGVTNVSRSAASSVSPFLTGYAISNIWIGSPFIIAGLLKICYDLAMYKSFNKTRLLGDDNEKKSGANIHSEESQTNPLEPLRAASL